MKACLEIIWECQFKLKSNNAKETPLKFWALEKVILGDAIDKLFKLVNNKIR